MILPDRNIKNKKKIDICKLREKIFYFGFLFMVFCKGMGFYSGDRFYTILVGISLLAVGTSILLIKHSKLEWVIMGILIALGCIVYMNSHDITLLMAVIVAIAMKNIEIEPLIKESAIVWISGFIITVILSFFNVRKSEVFTYWKPLFGRFWGGQCSSYGFNSRVTFGVTAVIAIVLIAYNIKEFTWKKLILLYLGIWCIFMVNFGYSILAFGIIGVTSIYMADIIKKKNINLLKRIYSFGIIFTSAITIIISMPPVQEVLLKTNIFREFAEKVCTNRPMISDAYYRAFDVTLLGQELDLELIEEKKYMCQLDNAYAYMLLRWGIVAFTIVLVFFFKALLEMKRQMQLKMMALSMFFICYGYSELVIRNPFMNFSLIIMVHVLRSKHNDVVYV